MKIDFHALTEQCERVHSKRLALRPVALCDAWPLFLATRNPLFNRWLLWDQPANEAHVLDRIDTILDAIRQGRLTAMSAVLMRTGEWVGLYRFQPYAANPAWLEMGIWMHDKFWHEGYSLELSVACIDAVFQFAPGFNTLVAAAAVENKGSCGILKKYGARPTKLVLRQTEGATKVELQEWVVVRSEWLAARKQPLYAYVPPRGSSIVHAPSESLAGANEVGHALAVQATPAQVVQPAKVPQARAQAQPSAQRRRRAPKVDDASQLTLELSAAHV